MDQLVAEQGDQKAQYAEQDDVALVAERARGGDGLGGEQGVADEEPQVDEHDEQQRHYCAEYAELGSALDHLRYAQPRPLGGMRGHENRADHGAQQDRQCAPEQVEPQADRQHTRSDGGDVGVGAEPDKEQ